jgi:hypothetical protein
MADQGQGKTGIWSYSGAIACADTGLRGFSVRVLPHHELIASKHDLGLIRWADA